MIHTRIKRRAGFSKVSSGRTDHGETILFFKTLDFEHRRFPAFVFHQEKQFLRITFFY